MPQKLRSIMAQKLRSDSAWFYILIRLGCWHLIDIRWQPYYFTWWSFLPSWAWILLHIHTHTKQRHALNSLTATMLSELPPLKRPPLASFHILTSALTLLWLYYGMHAVWAGHCLQRSPWIPMCLPPHPHPHPHPPALAVPNVPVPAVGTGNKDMAVWFVGENYC